MTESLSAAVVLRDDLKRFRAQRGIRTWKQLAFWLGQPVRVLEGIRHLRPIDAAVASVIKATLDADHASHRPIADASGPKTRAA